MSNAKSQTAADTEQALRPMQRTRSQAGSTQSQPRVTDAMLARHLMLVAMDAASEGDSALACHLVSVSYIAFDDTRPTAEDNRSLSSKHSARTRAAG